MREDAAAAGEALARLLKESRAAAGVTQDDVVAATPVSKRTYIRWEQGQVDLATLLLIAEVCRFLKVNPLHAARALTFVSADELDAEDDPLLLDVRRVLQDRGTAAETDDTVRRLLALAVRLAARPRTAEADETAAALVRAVTAVLDLADAAAAGRSTEQDAIE